jgi:hypothetical protein
MLKTSRKAVLIGLIVCALSTPTMVFATNKEVNPISATATSSFAVEHMSDYIAFKGTIEKVINSDNKTSILVKRETSEGEDIALFNFTDKVLLLDQKSQDLVKYDSFQEGTSVTAYYRRDTIMTMIYPPNITPSVIVVNSSEKASSIEVSKFDDNLLNSEALLKLNVSDKTTIMYKDGIKAEKADLANKDLVVFYNFMTKSLPAQTTPEKIIIINNANSDTPKTNSDIPKTNSALSFLKLFIKLFR